MLHLRRPSAPSDVVDGKELTFGEAHELYEKTAKPTLKPSTAIGYKKNVVAYLVPRFGAWPLSEINSAALIGFDQELARQGLSPSTRNNILIPLRTIIWNAIELGRHQGKPDFPKLNRVRSKVFEPPSVDDVDAVVAAADDYARVAIALASSRLQAPAAPGVTAD